MNISRLVKYYNKFINKFNIYRNFVYDKYGILNLQVKVNYFINDVGIFGQVFKVKYWVQILYILSIR